MSAIASVLPGAGPIAAALMNPLIDTPNVEVETSVVSCKGCGVLFGKAFENHETCPVCLKTVGWKQVGTLKTRVE